MLVSSKVAARARYELGRRISRRGVSASATPAASVAPRGAARGIT
jgi:hypothetical protein